MGFQASDVVDFGRSLLEMQGVSGVWYLPAMMDQTATLYVLVRGFDADAFDHRLSIREAIEAFIAEHDSSMRASGFSFVYEVAVDDDELGSPQIPDGAEQIAA